MSWVLIISASMGRSNDYPQHMFLRRNKTKYSYSLVEKKTLTWTFMDILHYKEPQIRGYPEHMFIGLDKSGYQVHIFLISPRKHMLWYSLEMPRRGASNEYPQHMFSWRNKKKYQ